MTAKRTYVVSGYSCGRLIWAVLWSAFCFSKFQATLENVLEKDNKGRSRQFENEAVSVIIQVIFVEAKG